MSTFVLVDKIVKHIGVVIDVNRQMWSHDVTERQISVMDGETMVVSCGWFELDKRDIANCALAAFLNPEHNRVQSAWFVSLALASRIGSLSKTSSLYALRYLGMMECSTASHPESEADILGRRLVRVAAYLT